MPDQASTQKIHTSDRPMQMSQIKKSETPRMIDFDERHMNLAEIQGSPLYGMQANHFYYMDPQVYMENMSFLGGPHSPNNKDPDSARQQSTRKILDTDANQV